MSQITTELKEVKGEIYKIKRLAFDELGADLLYRILHERQKVFVLEQNCAYIDNDFKDINSLHLVVFDRNDEIAAYARILPKGLAYNECSIGRVLTNTKYRNKGLGKAVFESALEACETLFPGQSIKIQAQTYLLDFYKSFGFEVVGEDYFEDGILHTDMLLSK